jgi:hypothetical protein
VRIARRLAGIAAGPGAREDAAPLRALADGELPRLAVMTMARDEGPMLRRWVDHYAAQVGADALVVVDDNSSDGSTDDLPCPVLRIPPLKEGFEGARMRLLSQLAASLLEAYDAVLFSDADEFVVADPARHSSLRHLVAARHAERVADPSRVRALGVVGLNVLHDAAREGPLHDGVPLLEQRSLVKFLPLMCKPALKWVPAGWAHASHGILCPFEVDPDLWMFHLKFADRDHLAAVAARRHELNVRENRAPGTSWAKGADEMVAVLDDAAAGIAPGGPADVPPFRVPLQRLPEVVEQRGDMWRAVGAGQVQAMRNRPVHRIPDRFRGLV